MGVNTQIFPDRSNPTKRVAPAAQADSFNPIYECVTEWTLDESSGAGHLRRMESVAERSVYFIEASCRRHHPKSRRAKIPLLGLIHSAVCDAISSPRSETGDKRARAARTRTAVEKDDENTYRLRGDLGRLRLRRLRVARDHGTGSNSVACHDSFAK